MKIVFGLILILAGICFGTYVGGWVCFVGGVVDIVQAFQAETLVALAVAIGCAKVFFATMLGGVAAYALIIPGIALMVSE